MLFKHSCSNSIHSNESSLWLTSRSWPGRLEKKDVGSNQVFQRVAYHIFEIPKTRIEFFGETLVPPSKVFCSKQCRKSIIFSIQVLKSAALLITITRPFLYHKMTRKVSIFKPNLQKKNYNP